MRANNCCILDGRKGAKIIIPCLHVVVPSKSSLITPSHRAPSPPVALARARSMVHLVF